MNTSTAIDSGIVPTMINAASQAEIELHPVRRACLEFSAGKSSGGRRRAVTGGAEFRAGISACRISIEAGVKVVGRAKRSVGRRSALPSSHKEAARWRIRLRR